MNTCSVSAKFAACPSLLIPRVMNRLPGRLQSFLEIRMKSTVLFGFLDTYGLLIKTYPSIQGILNGENDGPDSFSNKAKLKAY